MTRDEGILLVTEQHAERVLLADGFVKVPCGACEAKGHFSLGVGTDWKKYSCEACGGAGWTWQNPPPVKI